MRGPLFAAFALLWACQPGPPTPATAAAVFALDEAQLGPISAVRVDVQPGGAQRFEAPLGPSVFVPLPAGEPVSLTVTAFVAGVERWRGSQAVPALTPGARFAATVDVLPVGRLEVMGLGGGVPLTIGVDAPEVPLDALAAPWVLPVGRYHLWVGEPPIRHPDAAFDVEAGQITRWVAPVCAADEGACDGLDDDCDGALDEGLLNACGGCGEAPAEVCDGALDEDCDGAVDEGVRNACGACGDPPVEICDGLDEDCDGEVDEGLVGCAPCDSAVADCRVFRSCLHAALVGATHDGPHRLGEGDEAVFPAWCDHGAAGGGWTLVASTTGSPTEAAGPWHPALGTTAPTGESAGAAHLWAGLGALEGALDLRFACRAEASADPHAPFDVDLQVAGAELARTFGQTEAEACLQDVALERVDRLTGARAGGGVAMEPACDSPDHFAIALDGRVGDAPDSTAWGTWAGVRYCGEAAGADLPGQWFVFARERRRAGRVALLTPGDAVPELPIDALELPEPQAIDRYTYDAVWLHGDADAWAAVPERLAVAEAFSADGGGVVVTGGVPAVIGGPPEAWLPTHPTGLPVGTTDLIPAVFGVEPDRLWADLPTPFPLGVPPDGLFGFALDDETRLGSVALAAGARAVSLDVPVIARGRRCGGSVVMAGLPTVGAEGVLAPLLAAVAEDVVAPAPAWLIDVCPIGAPRRVQRCGGVTVELPGVDSVDGCSLDSAPDVLLLGPEARIDELGDLAAFVADGGVVVGSRGLSAALMLAVFGERAELGRAFGVCGLGDLRPAMVHTPDHWFWRHNALRAVDPDLHLQACGQDLSGFPGLVALGGWSEGTVSVGYRDRGAGRVWFLESDWPTWRKIQPGAAGLLRSMLEAR